VSRLDGRTILVVGATAGIGAAIYRQCAAAGAEVIGVGRNETQGTMLANEVGGIFIRADITEAADVERLFGEIVRRELSIDGAVNNAAVTQAAAPIDETPLDEFDRLVAVNLRGTWLCVANEIRLMRCRGGSIVNISSIAGKRGFSGLSAYCATKHAVVGLTRSAALDGARDGIRVNAILPGTTRTEMMEEQMRTRPGGLDGTLARIPMGRVSEPSEQASAALWLLSDVRSFVTGECLTVDGGTTART
jgi:NAD(P)-dependent dehydrogenase (short-subunit alcohol dehydrogenase family)